MPAVRGDGMRGLAVFISDIRNCKLYLFINLSLNDLVDPGPNCETEDL